MFINAFHQKSFNMQDGSIHRFNLSHRDIENLLAERGITVSKLRSHPVVMQQVWR